MLSFDCIAYLRNASLDMARQAYFLCFVGEQKYQICRLPFLFCMLIFALFFWSTYFYEFRQQTFFQPHFLQFFFNYSSDKLFLYNFNFSVLDQNKYNEAGREKTIFKKNKRLNKFLEKFMRATK